MKLNTVKTVMTMMTLATLVLACGKAFGRNDSGFGLDVLVDGSSRHEYRHQGRVYVEALRGREYTLRITNPTPYRVAVALSVDGLNTIDARHTDSWSAAKWVLDPYETTEIEGWQVNESAARKFYFTGEQDSYGAALGQTKNLGVIEAVFYRERERRVYNEPQPWTQRDSAAREESSSKGRAPAAQAPSAAGATEKSGALSDDYAATGMGDKTRNDVYRVEVDLDPSPVASVRIRYEFRDQLVKMGIMPDRSARPLDRRERASGFSWCPEQ